MEFVELLNVMETHKIQCKHEGKVAIIQTDW